MATLRKFNSDVVDRIQHPGIKEHRRRPPLPFLWGEKSLFPILFIKVIKPEFGGLTEVIWFTSAWSFPSFLLQVHQQRMAPIQPVLHPTQEGIWSVIKCGKKSTELETGRLRAPPQVHLEPTGWPWTHLPSAAQLHEMGQQWPWT